MTQEELLDTGFKFHGHRCPAMPLGLKAGQAAMKALGVERAQDKELVLVSETGKAHAAGCLLDGIMVATGCTYGKANCQKVYHGKMAFTLFDTKNGKKIRAIIKPEFFKKMLQSPFVQERKKGIPPQNINSEIAEPLISKVLKAPEDAFLELGSVESYEVPKGKGCFDIEPCEACGELTFTTFLEKKDGKKLCKSCIA